MGSSPVAVGSKIGSNGWSNLLLFSRNHHSIGIAPAPKAAQRSLHRISRAELSNMHNPSDMLLSAVRRRV